MPASLPDFSLETQIGGTVAAIDEAGRGPWAGPVVAAAVILEPTCIPDGLNDSKKLTSEQRERCHAALEDGALHIGIGQADVQEIDALNILQATLLAMRRALDALPLLPDHVLIDGNRVPRPLRCPATPVIGGDSKSLSIAAASIVAKVTRDRIMARCAEEFPMYGWHTNAGYGTRAHQEALRRHGPSVHHRRSFRPIRELLATRETAA